MDNKEELDYNEIGKITSDFIKVSDQLKTTCEKIIEKGFSKYPVIILSKENKRKTYENYLNSCFLKIFSV